MTCRHSLLFCQEFPTAACVAGNGGVRSLRDNVASAPGGLAVEGVSQPCDCEQQGSWEPGTSGRVNPGEVLLKVVMFDKPGVVPLYRTLKLLLGLNQKVCGQVQGLQRSPAADGVPPAERHDLTHSVALAERGKPVVLLLG